MNAGHPTHGASRTNRPRRSPARALGAALGRLIAIPPEPTPTRESAHMRAFTASWPRFALA